MVSMANNTPNATPAVVCKQSPTNYGHEFQNKTRSPIQKKAKRHRKQTITSRLSDSGIEEDLSAQSPVGTVVLSGEGTTSAGQLCLLTWLQHYGNVGYQIQKDNETQFHLPKCLARQPQVGQDANIEQLLFQCTLIIYSLFCLLYIEMTNYRMMLEPKSRPLSYLSTG